MNDITALAQRLKVYAEEFSYPVLSPDDCRALVEALEAGDTENERMARDLISRNGEIEGLRKRVEELEEVATDYGMKFQRAQDDLKKMALMKSRTVTVKLPEEAVDQVCLAAAEIHNRGNGVSDDKAQFIINRIRNYLENGGELKGAGIQVIEGEE